MRFFTIKNITLWLAGIFVAVFIHMNLTAPALATFQLPYVQLQLSYVTNPPNLLANESDYNCQQSSTESCAQSLAQEVLNNLPSNYQFFDIGTVTGDNLSIAGVILVNYNNNYTISDQQIKDDVCTAAQRNGWGRGDLNRDLILQAFCDWSMNEGSDESIS